MNSRPPDDSDMKIADFRTPSGQAREPREEQEYLRNKENGNLARARELGTRLAELALACERPMSWSLFAEDESGSLSSQKRILMSFALSVGLRAHLHNPYVTDTAINVFDEQIKEHAPDFYEDIHETVDYSFYYLAYRRGGDAERNIGRTFAMLCGQDGNGVYSELGEVLFCRFYHEVKKVADGFSFKDAD